MFEQKNIWQFTKNFTELERLIDTGYVDPTVMFKVDKFSRSVLANNTVTLLSSFNNLNPFLDSATELFIASDDNNDTMPITIQYIDQDRNSQEVTVTLTGTTPISLGLDIYCIWRMYNSGSVDHQGTVTVTSNVSGVPLNDSEVYCELTIINGYPNNQSLTGIYSIPAGYSGFITRASVQADKGSDIKGAMFIRPQGNVFRFVKALAAYQNEAIYLDLFQRLPEKTDIRPFGYAQTGGISYTEYTIICINNEYLDKHLK